jgi:guanylate cyclase
MIIQTIGRSLSQILPKLPGQKINEFFDLVRPLVEFKFDAVLARSNNIFEIMTVEPIDALLRVTVLLHQIVTK